jgi:phosphotriesterase-related protein
MTTRREFLFAAAAAAAAKVSNSWLVHEHVLVDFGGVVTPGSFDPEEVFRLALPKLKEAKALGCRRFLDCTPAYLGRNTPLLLRLEEASGIEIWTNTGIYGAADRKAVPPHARTSSADLIASWFVSEWKKGISGVKPRFIKTAVANARLDELDRKLARAAAIASRETGLTIASHTGSGTAAIEELEILDAEKVRPEKFVWVHANSEKDHAYHEKVARAGAWVEFDGFREGKSDWQLECVRWMASKGFLDRTLIANDSGWYNVGQPEGGNFEGYTYIYTGFLPQLDAKWHKKLMVENPERAFGK